jgi:spore maturation protein CgeB
MVYSWVYPKGPATNIAFLNQSYLIQRETVEALRRIPDARVAAIDIAAHPTLHQVNVLCGILEQERCGAVVTINEWGTDTGGRFCDFCESRKIIHCNWCVDDPFYEEIILAKKYRPSPLRFDFVSDRGYVQPMRERGYRAFFLPLCTDPALFHPGPAAGGERFDLVFVGNSYLRQMDDMLALAPEFVDSIAPFLGGIIGSYLENVEYDIEARILEVMKSISLPRELSFEKACYIAKHAAGYFGRKRIVIALARRYPGFRVFGDAGWLRDLPPERVGSAGYYNTLADVYRHARIAIDINRMVIRNGFTQRPFDILASGGFVLTSAKPVVGDFFSPCGPEKDISVFHSEKELFESADYYLSHDRERLAIAGRGRSKVLSAHTYDHRMAAMFLLISQELAAMQGSAPRRGAPPPQYIF